MISVVIVDQKSSRGNSMLSAFGTLSEICSLLHTHEDDSSKWRTVKGSSPQPSEEHQSPLVVLRHFRDQEHLKDLGDSSSTIYYGGNGANDRDAPNKRHFAIQRPVNSADDSLTKTEAHELLVFLGEIRGKPETEWPDPAEWPTVIRPSQYSEYWTSLPLLWFCEGYLAQFALKNQTVGGGLDTKGFADVGKALKAMGWVEDEDARKVSKVVKELGLECTPTDSKQPDPSADCWKSPFEGQEKMLKKALQDECSPLRAKVERKFTQRGLRWLEESELPESTRQLVDAIDKGEVSGDSFVEVVAGAYLELKLLMECAGF